MESIEYFDDPLCEDAVGEHLTEAARYYSDGEDDWYNDSSLQADWHLAANAYHDAEQGLEAIYDGEVTDDSAPPETDETTPDDDSGDV